MGKSYRDDIPDDSTDWGEEKKKWRDRVRRIKYFFGVVDRDLRSLDRYLPEASKSDHEYRISREELLIESPWSSKYRRLSSRLYKSKISSSKYEKSYEVSSSGKEESVSLSYLRSNDRTDDEKYDEYDCRECSDRRRSELRRRDLTADQSILPDDIERVCEPYPCHRYMEEYWRYLRKEKGREEKYSTDPESQEEHESLTISRVEWTSDDIGDHTSEKYISGYPFEGRRKVTSIDSPEEILHPSIEETPESDKSKKWEEWTIHKQNYVGEINWSIPSMSSALSRISSWVASGINIFSIFPFQPLRRFSVWWFGIIVSLPP